MDDKREVKLILEDGTVFKGISFGAQKNVSGEVVFNTGMVGYPESLTDPSYKGQILTFTYPLIGNYGVPKKVYENGVLTQFESNKIQATAMIVSDYSKEYSHWNAVQSLGDWLKNENIPGIYGIDTRRLTKILREKGTMLGKIVFSDSIDFFDPNMKDIVQEVTTKEKIIYNPNGSKKIILIDCGVKNNIIRNFLKYDAQIIRVPYNYNFFQEDFDAVFVSNGPGNPKMCTETIKNVQKALQNNIPTFGICLGSQILALAAGGDTFKLKYGHRSQNQPCIMSGTKRCFITTQNHGYAVHMDSLGSEWKELFVNANDKTNEGIKHESKPFFAVQFHPESMPGPYDTEFLFKDFMETIK